jgi:hypothetical protein
MSRNDARHAQLRHSSYDRGDEGERSLIRH